MRDILVSVIVPLYNVEAYLPACLDSLRAQTRRDFEAILVDDGSGDGSGAICDAYAAKDERFCVLHQANAGVAAARNAGLDRARGSHISFVDSDDEVSPRFLETLLAAGADVAQCGFVTERGGLAGAGAPAGGQAPGGAPALGREGHARNAGQDAPALGREAHAHAAGQAVPAPAFERMSGRDASRALQLDGTGTWGVLWNKLYRASLFEGVRFPAGRQHEDEFAVWRTLWAAANVATCAEPLYFYRQRPGSIMAAGVSGRSLDALVALEERGAFYRAHADEELADLSDAVLCHRIGRVLAGASHAPEQAPAPADLAGWRTKRDALLKRLLASPHLSAKKKAALLARRVLPGL